MTFDHRYWLWKIAAFKLLKKTARRSMLDAEEQRIMDKTYRLGQSPDFFVKLLAARDTVSRDTVENMK